MLSQILEMDENILAALILLIGLAIAYWIYGPKQQPYVVKTLDSNSSKIGGNNKNVKNTSSTSSSTTSKTSATSKSSVEKRSDKHLSLFFGSQTGTAEDFARTIAKDAKAMGFKTAVIDLEDYSAESDIQREGLCMFFMATYGEGEPTDNAKEFYEWLEACEDSLSNISYSVFGLGNKTYEHYNNIGKNVDKWLEERGATRLAPVGLGDDDMSLEDDFAEWRVNALAPFAAKAGIAVKADDAGKGKRAKFVPSFVLQKYAANSSEAKQAATREKTDTGGLGVRALNGEALRSSKHDSFDARQPLCAYIAVNRELHSDKSDRSCRHIEIETNGLLKYEAGDHVGVFAENTADDVEKLAQRLKLDLDEVVSLDEPADDRREAHSIVGPATLRHIFMRLLEINGQIRQATVGALAEFASDAKEKATLQGWADDTDSYMKQCKDACRTVPQLLDEMPSLNPPLAVLLELLPRLAPRYYSLSSSPSVHGTRLHVTCVVVQHKTSTGRLLNGLCSSWFSRVAGVPDQPVACFVRKSNFRLPAQLDVPMLMFGPGTGIAPFRGFLHELRARRESAATAPPSNIVLYYGCRRIDTDSLYIDELRSFRDDGTTRRIYVAESRLEPDEQPLEIHFPGDDLIEEHGDKPRPKYVQHLLSRLADSKRAADMLQQPGAHVYICGDARYMAKDVHEALRLAIAGDVEPNTEQLKKADDLLALLSKEGRYQKDVWY